MASCSGITAVGGLCKGQTISNSQYCFSHSPDHAEARKRRASRGGKQGGRGRQGGAVTEVAVLKARLANLADDVLAGKVDRGAAIAANQVFNTMLRCCELEHRRDGVVTPEELAEQMQIAFDVFRRHVPERERLRALDADLAAILDISG